MVTLRQRFDIHRDLGQWSMHEYATQLGYPDTAVKQLADYLSGRREMTPAEAALILRKHFFVGRDNELGDEIIVELERLAATAP